MPYPHPYEGKAYSHQLRAAMSVFRLTAVPGTATIPGSGLFIADFALVTWLDAHLRGKLRGHVHTGIRTAPGECLENLGAQTRSLVIDRAWLRWEALACHLGNACHLLLQFALALGTACGGGGFRRVQHLGYVVEPSSADGFDLRGAIPCCRGLGNFHPTLARSRLAPR